MRLAAGFVAYNLVLAALGMALLYAAGLVTLRPARLAAAAGAALVTGAAVAGVLAGIALTAGLTLHALPDTVVLLVLTAALAVVGRLRGPVREDATGFEPSRAATVVAALVAVFVVIQGGLSRHVAPAWDAAHNWYLKAVALGDHASLTGTMLFSDAIFTPSHQTYPLVHPVLGGLLFQYIGNDESGRLVSELWILLGATVLAAPFLAGGGRRGWMALIPFAVAAGGAANQDLLRGDADLTMACFLAVGALALGRWLDDGPPGLLVPAVACLGAAANTKNEGLAFALGTALAAAAVALAVRRRRAPLLVGGGVALAALIAPWLIWVHANGPFGTDVTPLSKSLHGSLLSDQLPLLDFAAREVIGQLCDQVSYGWVFPLALVLTGVLIVTGPRRAIAAFYLGAVLLAVAALLWVYWTYTGPGGAGHVQRTINRTVLGPLFLCAAALAHLLPRLVAPPRLAAADEAGWHH